MAIMVDKVVSFLWSLLSLSPPKSVCVAAIVAIATFVHYPACFATSFVMDDRPALQYVDASHACLMLSSMVECVGSRGVPLGKMR